MSPLPLPEIRSFLVVFGFSVGLTWIVRAAAYRYGFVSMPRAERWHSKPRALLGGIGIAVSFLIGFMLFVPKEHDNLLLVLCGGAMFCVGLVDDLVHLKPQTKLIAQIVIGAALAQFGMILHFSNSELTNFAITLFWLIGISNAMNLLDNMDGLCGGIAVIAGGYRLLFCSLEGHAAGVMLALVFIAAVAGFLIFNFNPASIFMGDCGSLFIGLMVAGMNISSTHTYAKSVISVLLFPVLILIIPIFDTALVTVIRKFSGRPISVGGKDHSSHRLVAVGLSERKAVLILYFISVTAGSLAYGLYQKGFSYTLFFIGLFTAGMVLFGVFLSTVKVYSQEAVGALDDKNFFQLVADIPYKKYLLLVVLDACLILTSYYGAYWLRFDGIRPGDDQFPLFQKSFPIVLVLSLISFFVSGLYRHHWRYTGVRDLWVIIKGSLAGVTATVVALSFAYHFEGFSRSVFLIYWGTVVMLLAGSRISFRLLTEVLSARPAHHKRVLVYGAGDGGELLLRELKNNFDMETVVVGFLDDNSDRLKSKIHGIPVLGEITTAEFWIRKHSVSQVIISSRKIPPSKVSQIQEVCERLNIELLRASMKLEKAVI